MSIKHLLSEGIQSTPPSFVRGILEVASDPEIISFAGGLPNPISFPQEELLASMERVVKTYGSRVFQYSITAIQAFSLSQPVFYPVELTEKGLDLEQLKEALEHKAKFIYLIPEFQNPAGLTYSAENREEIYEVLKDRDVVLIEDDPYGELRFAGERLPYIGAGRLENSMLLGTFSKIVTPGMRTGFIISENTELLRYFSIAKEASDLHINIFSQYLIWDYLIHNDLNAHIAKIKELYQKQALAMICAMEKYFPETVTYTRPRGGMFLWVTLPEGISAMSVFERALEKKVAFVPGDPFYTDVKDARTMRLNYTNADCETIEEGIRRLGELLEEI